MNAYGYRENTKVKRSRSAIATAILVMRAVFEVICERITAARIRMVAVVFSMVLLLGIAGGMEAGTISLYVGFPVCLVIASVFLLMNFDD